MAAKRHPAERERKEMPSGFCVSCAFLRLFFFIPPSTVSGHVRKRCRCQRTAEASSKGYGFWKREYSYQVWQGREGSKDVVSGTVGVRARKAMTVGFLVITQTGKKQGVVQQNLN